MGARTLGDTDAIARNLCVLVLARPTRNGGFDLVLLDLLRRARDLPLRPLRSCTVLRARLPAPSLGDLPSLSTALL